MKLVSNRTNWILALFVVVLVVAPLALVKGKFEGSDDQGSAAIAASQPNFKPWAHPIWTPPSPEIESLLFALQAAIGGKFIAREDLSAYRKDVTTGLYGGDVSRKKKVLAKQAKGKKRLKRFGKVDIPSEAFTVMLKRD